MTATIAQAEAHCANQSQHGPRFGVNECQMQCRIAYDIPSDGTPNATQGWLRAKDRHPSTDPRATPRGAFNHWVGGSHGDGHVTISRFQLSQTYPSGPDWSTDVTWVGGNGLGYFNSVDPSTITQHWTSLHYVGWSWDIDGVSVKPPELPKTKRPHITAAVKATRIALGRRKNDTPRKRHLATALRELLRALGGSK